MVEENPNNIPLPPAVPKKQVYTPFPPPQQPSKLDMQMASGEYFLKPKDRDAIEKRKREEKQAAKAEQKRAMREEALIAPPENVEVTVSEKKKKRKREAEEA